MSVALLVGQAAPDNEVVVQRPDAATAPTPPASEGLVPEQGAPPPATSTPPLVAEPPPPTEPVDVAAPVASPEPQPPEPEPEPQPQMLEPEPELADDTADEAPFDLSVYEADLDREALHNQKTARARTLVAAGGLAGVGSLLLLIAAGVEASKPKCKFGLDECDSGPRKGVAAGLGVTGGILAAGSVALISVGVLRLRRLKVGVSADEQSAVVRVGGRF